jgi:hypothetical protein
MPQWMNKKMIVNSAPEHESFAELNERLETVAARLGATVAQVAGLARSGRRSASQLDLVRRVLRIGNLLPVALSLFPAVWRVARPRPLMTIVLLGSLGYFLSKWHGDKDVGNEDTKHARFGRNQEERSAF